jgi:hypothetical protein
MRISRMLIVAPALVLAAACSSKKDDTSVDDALRNDLALAATQQPYQPQQYMSPVEAGYYGQVPQQYAPMGYGPQPVYAPAPAPARVVYRSAPAARSTSSGTNSGTARAPQGERVVKHTGRDAAIGAAAGAVIGATSSRDKLKGAVIGAAAGGLLGAVIGNNVDVKRIPQF